MKRSVILATADHACSLEGVHLTDPEEGHLGGGRVAVKCRQVFRPKVQVIHLKRAVLGALRGDKGVGKGIRFRVAAARRGDDLKEFGHVWDPL